MALLDAPHEDSYRAIPAEGQTVTVERLKEFLPKSSRANISEEVVRLVNEMGESTDLPQNLLEEDLFGYLHLVTKIQGTSVTDVINAVKFCNLKRNYNNKKAWSIVFPVRYTKLVDSNKQVDNHVSMYNNSALVRAIDKEMQIPAHLMYSPYFHFGVKKLFELANGKSAPNADGEAMTVSPLVQMNAAKELVTITAQPIEAKIDIKLEQSDAMVAAQLDMNSQLSQLVQAQAKRFRAGEDTADIQRVHVIDVEVEV